MMTQIIGSLNQMDVGTTTGRVVYIMVNSAQYLEHFIKFK